jgi:tubulin-specific chaperone A
MAPPSKLTITTSTVQRLVREEASYYKEALQQEERIKQLESSAEEENKAYMIGQEACPFVDQAVNMLLTAW